MKIATTYRNGDRRYYSLKSDFVCLTDIKAGELKKLGVKYIAHQYYYSWQFIVNISELPKLKPFVESNEYIKRYLFEYDKRVYNLIYGSKIAEVLK